MSNFWAQFFSSFGLQFLWSMINGLQLIAHLPLFSISLPAVTLSFFKELQFVVGFDWFENYNNEVLKLSFGITETEPYNLRFKSIGFDEHNILINAGCLMFFLCFVVIKILVALGVSIFRCRCKKEKGKKRMVSRSMNSKLSLINCCKEFQVSIWLVHQNSVNLVFRFLLETLLDLIICVWIGFGFKNAVEASGGQMTGFD